MNPFIQSKIVLFLSLNRSEPVWAGLNRSKPFKTDKHDTRDKTTHAANMTRMKSTTRIADSTHVRWHDTRDENGTCGQTDVCARAITCVKCGECDGYDMHVPFDWRAECGVRGWNDTRVGISTCAASGMRACPNTHVLSATHAASGTCVGSATHVVLFMHVAFVTCVMCVARVMFIHLNLA